MTLPPFFSRALLICLVLGLTPLASSAQPADTSVTQGPMIVERMHSGFLVAPEAKVTEVDRRTSELVGGYAGWISDDRLFIGGGGYWMPSSSREMAYGGLVVGWMARPSDRIGFSAKALLGGGEAASTPFHYREDFVAVEPELGLRISLSRRVRFTGGVGYRFIGTEFRDSNRLRGATGSVGLQFGTGG